MSESIVKQAQAQGFELRVGDTHGARFVTVGKVIIIDEAAEDPEATAREALASL